MAHGSANEVSAEHLGIQKSHPRRWVLIRQNAGPPMVLRLEFWGNAGHPGVIF
jgi:hypothetical protein